VLTSADDGGVADLDTTPGAGTVRYRPESLLQLCKLTKFSKRELQLMYRGFKQVCPNGVVSLEQFKEIYANFFPHGHKSNADTGRYAVYVFNTFDRDKNGYISFEEFVVGLSILSRGTTEEKLRWVFDLYDVDQDGLLTKEDIEQVVGSVYEMMGSPTDPPIEENTVQEHIDFVFNKMDDNGDGFITLQEFLETCGHDEAICQSLGLFDTILTCVPKENLQQFA